jgi:phage gp16-like protein
MMRMTAMTSAIWISQPKTGKIIKPNSHKTNKIIPIINKIFTVFSFLINILLS